MSAVDLQSELAQATLHHGESMRTPAGFELMPHPTAENEAYIFVKPDGSYFEIPVVIDFVDEDDIDQGAIWHIALAVPPEPPGLHTGQPGFGLNAFIRALFHKLIDSLHAMRPQRVPGRIVWEA